MHIDRESGGALDSVMQHFYAAPTFARVSEARWEPMPLQRDHLLDGDPAPLVHWLRKNGPGQPLYMAGLWEVRPATFRWIFSGNESFFVLEGRATIVTDEGISTEVQAGDMVSYLAGTASIWTVHETLRKFFMITH